VNPLPHRYIFPSNTPPKEEEKKGGETKRDLGF
jgi:hypothetical protein